MSQLNSTTTRPWTTIGYGESERFEEIEESGTYDYSWAEIRLVREIATGQLWYGENSGCSCNWFWDSPDMTPVKSWQEWAELAQEWANDRSDGDEKRGAMDCIERLNQSRPAPSPKAA